MGALSPFHIVIIVVLLLLVFGGGGKISAMMSDAAKGMKSFKQGLKDDEEPASPPAPAVTPVAANPVVAREADG